MFQWITIKQGSPQEKIKAELVGVAWAGFVTTLIILVATSKKYLLKAWGGAMLKGPGENTVKARKIVLW